MIKLIKWNKDNCNLKNRMAPAAGLEPATYGLTVHRSTNWTMPEYLRHKKHNYIISVYKQELLISRNIANNICMGITSGLLFYIFFRLL